MADGADENGGRLDDSLREAERHMENDHFHHAADSYGMHSRNGDAVGARGSSGNDLMGSAALRPIFLGNLYPGYNTDDVTAVFEKPMMDGIRFDPMPVDRVDVKRGYCFVFLKDATSQAFKEQTERYVSAINGM